MKRVLFSFASLLLSAGLGVSLWASPVTAPEAEAYAVAYGRNVLGAQCAVANVDTVSLSGTSVCYRVAWQGGGWTLVAADDVVEPIVGFSETGDFDVHDLIPPLRSYLTGVASRIAAGGEKSACWTTDSIASTNKSADEIDPLIQVNWNQTGVYNEYCPTQSGEKTLVGCVAVALGQAMSVFQQPARPSGSHSYSCEGLGRLSVNYDDEEAYDWDAIMNAQSDETDRRECARLLYHLGVAVDMEYSTDGSGAWPSAIPRAMKTYFGYTSTMKRVEKTDYATDDEWTDILLRELSEGHPLVYSGYDSQDEETAGGHCFNLDGYKNGQFHINWGWGGSGDGYYAIGAQTYKYYQETIVSFYPANGEPTAIALSNKTVARGAKAGTVVATISAESDDADAQWIFTASSTALPMPGMTVPFYFGTDGDKLIVTEDIPESVPEGRKLEVRITAQNAETGSSKSSTFRITVTKSSANSLPGVSADPTPATLYTLDGRKVGTTDDATPRPGIYIVRQQNGAKKILVR